MSDQPLRQRAQTEEKSGAKRDRTPPPAPEPLPHPVVDNHCHLDIVDGSPEDWAGPAAALDAAEEVGVGRIVQVGVDLAGSRWSAELAAKHDRVLAAVALHPNEAPRLAEAGTLEEHLAGIEALARDNERVRCIGETGLDFFRTSHEGLAAQEESFRRHIDIAKRHGKALMIHDREAHEAVLRVLDSEGAPERWVMHCFSGDADFARACLDRGAYLSFAGTVTFKNAEGLRDALRVTPRDRVLVETDAPFLTPTPYRGRPNASYLVPLTMRAMAEARGDDLGELCAAVAGNTETVYGAW
jgi:TatD DNase family protein